MAEGATSKKAVEQLEHEVGRDERSYAGNGLPVGSSGVLHVRVRVGVPSVRAVEQGTFLSYEHKYTWGWLNR